MENVISCILLVIPSYFKAPSSPGGGFTFRARGGGGNEGACSCVLKL